MRGTGDGYVCVSLKVGVYVLTGSRRYVDNKTKMDNLYSQARKSREQ